MLTAFISDVHANFPALEAVVADAKARGATKIYCAGDIIGYGPFPDEVCDYLQENQIEAISGNYDIKVMLVSNQGASAVKALQKKKQKALTWTAAHISQRTQHYVEALPENRSIDFPDHKKLLIVHGTPLDNDDDIYPSITNRGLQAKMGDVECDILVCGHTHIPFIKKVNKVLVINCGSAGQPVDGDARSCYALVEADNAGSVHARIIRVEYDVKKVISAMKETSLPTGLRKDFALGTKRIFLQ